MDIEAEKLPGTPTMTRVREMPRSRKMGLSALRQIKAFAKKPEMDCGCATVVGEVLTNLAPVERAAVATDIFAAAIRQRAKAQTLLELLQEFDQFGAATDIGELEEAALLFDDLAQQARLGSQLLRVFTFNRCDLRSIPEKAPEWTMGVES
ncbi:hypothetical protein [Rhizobium sp. AC44/96]|uniref:hypothetical protein n=1 Tax=Rhizobium sp. AC44/96 TaxID=1841654 RepID=UPI001FCD17CD|nr:hypothetical protein [Rhizobium sp. AC44/96]